MCVFTLDKKLQFPTLCKCVCLTVGKEKKKRNHTGWGSIFIHKYEYTFNFYSVLSFAWLEKKDIIILFIQNLFTFWINKTDNTWS